MKSTPWRGGNFGQIIQVILDLPAGVTLQDEDGWRAESRLVRYSPAMRAYSMSGRRRP